MQRSNAAVCARSNTAPAAQHVCGRDAGAKRSWATSIRLGQPIQIALDRARRRTNDGAIGPPVDKPEDSVEVHWARAASLGKLDDGPFTFVSHDGVDVGVVAQDLVRRTRGEMTPGDDDHVGALSFQSAS